MGRFHCIINHNLKEILDCTKMKVWMSRKVPNDREMIIQKFFHMMRGICMKFFIDTANMEEIKEVYE